MIDLRSDTVTRPTPAMRAAMAAAEVGDDVFGDDPTVRLLQRRLAALLGKEDALFVTSGTQSNLCALMAQCQRGDEYLVGQMAHCYRWEAGGAAVLGSIQPQPLAQGPDGLPALEEVRAAIKPDDPHFARTRLLALENTWGGRRLPQAGVEALCALAREHGLATHLDGARLFNAAVDAAAEAAEVADAGPRSSAGPSAPVVAALRTLVAPFDTVSVCLSKGLGAPVGSVLCGPAEVVGRARRLRKMLGGGLRQVGVLAAAGLHALDRHVDRLADDHARARRLAEGLQGLDGVRVDVHTNMVFVRLPAARAEGAVARLAAAGVACTGGASLRLVTHLDLDDDAIDTAVRVLRATL
ncbi:low-specificity L-threonine aldolase [Piscinibacter sakaiensis]|uniref:Low-specificity L-threonine aldolase n=2 Tax=Piscinibacter sakaiensis TaxID=1547922 RepID=A0A0K8P0Z0_PISS1|nr:low-specificity L-threonine aldolase [Piscinibacter sakaiensis]